MPPIAPLNLAALRLLLSLETNPRAIDEAMHQSRWQELKDIALWSEIGPPADLSLALRPRVANGLLRVRRSGRPLDYAVIAMLAANEAVRATEQAHQALLSRHGVRIVPGAPRLQLHIPGIPGTLPPPKGTARVEEVSGLLHLVRAPGTRLPLPIYEEDEIRRIMADEKVLVIEVEEALGKAICHYLADCWPW